MRDLDEQEERLLKTGDYRVCVYCGAFLERLAPCTSKCEDRDDRLIAYTEARMAEELPSSVIMCPCGGDIFDFPDGTAQCLDCGKQH